VKEAEGRSRRAARRTAAWALLLLWGMCWFGASPAWAHTALSGSSPADGDVLTETPDMLHLTFSGSLEASDSLHSMRLTDAEGAERALSSPELDGEAKSLMARVTEPLPNGPYTLAYRVVSRDGHPIEGEIAFRIDAPPEEEAPPTETAGEPPGAGTAEPTDGATPPDEATSGDEAPPEEGRPSDEAALPEEGNPSDDTAEHGHETEGDPADEQAPDMTPPPAVDSPPDGSDASSAADGIGFRTALFASRIVYYGTLLPLLGWALWSAFKALEGDRLAVWRRVGLRLQLAHAIAFALYATLHWLELSAGNPTASLPDALRDTGVGQSWMFTGLLTLAGFPLLFRSRFVDGGWAALMIGARTLSGHAGAFEPVVWTRTADAVHLAAAAVWAGGLLAAALLLKRRETAWFRAFAPSFSRAALLSFVALAATGVASAALYTEQWSDMLRTAWGRLLIAKVAVVAAVLPVAALLRRKLADAGEDGPGASAFRRWLRADFGLLVAVVAITGVLTHASPVVERLVFHWHAMGETVHFTIDIEDVREGNNALSVKVWVPEGEGPPNVSVAAVGEGRADAPAALHSADVPTEAWESFQGFEKYTFAGDLAIDDPDATAIRISIQRATGEMHENVKALTDR